MIPSGFILLHRKITEWEWYKNPVTFRVFLHILLKANYADGRFQGMVVKRGQLVTSLPKLAEETQQTIQQIRTALNHLKSTGEITDVATTQNRVITIVKYDEYQKDNRRDNSQSTDDQQTEQQTEQHQYNKYNKNNNNNNNHHSIFIPPTKEDVEQYCDEKGIFGFDAERFIDYYTSKGWMIGKNKMKDWRAAVRTWLRNDRERQKQKEQEYEELPF